ncbi:MAG: hypothetical protein REI09_11595 [Candidatus Dactylopiibacterium sp.]|nr:hypothetical protein [Candidatus Dactylopiibacterium sp.]
MIRKLFLGLLAATLALPAAAGPATDGLSACLADNTNGKERKELAKWIFVAMAAHPDITGLSTATAQNREQIDRSIGALVTRLLTESCAAQTHAAVRAEGGDALKTAFGGLGQLAMQELMTHREVSSSVTGFQRYLDRQKLEAVMSMP